MLAVSRARILFFLIVSVYAWHCPCGGWVAHAQQVSPLLTELESAGKGARSKIIVKNDAVGAIAIQIDVEERRFDASGMEMRLPANEDLLIFPPQALIHSGREQVLDVQWRGGPPTTSQSYAISISRVPVDLLGRRDGNGVQFEVSFETYLHVSPPGARSEIALSAQSLTQEEDGSRHIDFDISNIGDRHAYLSVSGALQLYGKNQSGHTVLLADWRGDDLIRLLGGDTLVAPGVKRRFQVSLPEGAGEDSRVRWSK